MKKGEFDWFSNFKGFSAPNDPQETVKDHFRVRAATEAEPLLREYLAAVDAQHSEAFDTHAARSSLGEAMALQEDFSAAEPLLIEAFEGIKGIVGFPPEPIDPEKNSQMTKTVDRLISLYSEWEKPDEVDKWRVVKAGITPKKK